MRAYWMAAAVAFVLAGCAGVEPVGRNAQRNQSAPAPVASAPAPRPVATPAPVVTPAAPAPQQQAAVTPPRPVVQPAPLAAQPVAPTAQPTPRATAPVATSPAASPAPQAAQPTQRITTRPNDNEVVVPGQVQRQVRPPQGDPRTNSERMEDIRAWDRCVIEVQGAAFDNDAMSPQLDTPEDVCRNQLGMADRTAIPISRRVRDR